MTIDSLSAAGDMLTSPFSEEEKERLQAELLQLLAMQIRRKTQGDSTSMREEEAAELLESIVFTLQFHLKANALPTRALLVRDPTALLRNAGQTLQTCLEETQKRYRLACETVKTFGSVSLQDTLRGIDGFFRAYDIRLYAHQIPADIDYQLYFPVPESFRGCEYLREYLNRLLMENELVSRFAPNRVAALLARACPDYRELLVNLYEPVSANVIGLSLLGGGETLLEITAPQSERIAGDLNRLQTEEAKKKLTAAAFSACERLGIQNPLSCEYLAQAALTLLPRIQAAPAGVQGVFSASSATSPM